VATDERSLQRLKTAAEEAVRNSYSPYSGLAVGAALIAPDGSVHVGCNVENASYGLTQCAERAALTGALANGVKPGTPKLMVIYAPGRHPLAPCGACRQVIHELMPEDARIVAYCDGDNRLEWLAGELLPDAFTPAALSRPIGRKV